MHLNKIINTLFVTYIMKRNTTCEIRCQQCGEWFKSGIFIGDAENYISGKITENQQQCPICGKMTGMNKDNMRFDERREDGRVTHEEGKDTF